MGLLSNIISRDDLKPGDHIYSWRKAYAYSHHGIYLGNGEVIHFTCGAGLEARTGLFLDKMQEVIHFSRGSGLEIGTGTFLDKMEEVIHFSRGGSLENGTGTVLDKIEEVIHFTRGGGLETRTGIFLDKIEEVIQFTRGIGRETRTETFLDKIEELIHFTRGGGLKTRTGTFLDKMEEVIRFTREGGLETRMGAFLNKLIVSSVPSDGGGNYSCIICGDQSKLDGVILSCLDCFLAGGNLYLYKYGVSKAMFMATPRSSGTCTIAPSDPFDEVISRTNSLFLLKEFGAYHLLENNCEDFAIYCKTGLYVSSETRSGSSVNYSKERTKPNETEPKSTKPESNILEEKVKCIPTESNKIRVFMTTGQFSLTRRMGLLSNKISRDNLKPGDHIYSWRIGYIYSHHGIYVGNEKVIHFTQGNGLEAGTGTFLDNIIVSSVPIPNHGGGNNINPCPNCGDQSKLNGVISSCLDCFLSGGNIYLFEYNVSKAMFMAIPRGGTCTTATSDPSDETISRANYLLLKKGFGLYDLFKNNCEDFAIYCKTGLVVLSKQGSSGQANSVNAARDVFSWSIAGSVASLGSAARYALFSTAAGFAVTGLGGMALAGYGKYCIGRLNSDIGVRNDVIRVDVERLVEVIAILEGGSDDKKKCS